MAPPQVSTLAANDLGKRLPGGRLPAETEAAVAESKILRLLVRALGRVAEVSCRGGREWPLAEATTSVATASG